MQFQNKTKIPNTRRFQLWQRERGKGRVQVTAHHFIVGTAKVQQPRSAEATPTLLSVEKVVVTPAVQFEVVFQQDALGLRVKG